MPIDASILHSIPLFELLDEAELSELAAHIDERTFRKDQLIFNTGDPGGVMYIVLSGKVQTYVNDDDGKKVVLVEAEPGNIFGELSFLDEEPRSATAMALEPTTTFVIDRDDLLRLVSKKPAAALDIMEILGKRLRATDVLLRQRVTKNANLLIEEKLSFGDRVADEVARFGGSWSFIILFGVIMVVWISLNLFILAHPFDPAPFIGLNLILSMLAALQAPIIMMSQNRQDAKDRVRSELDYNVNLKAEVEITELHQKIDRLQEEMMDHMDEMKHYMTATSANGNNGTKA